ncbi:trypsin-like peptidase domain-containing protein [Nocardia cerradoensis]|uniref:trypsin-like peptidase domain-containing protein n=1 Tax=Nocardia cerradoensis TaxID=85688 RepID=UPI001443ECFD|nr:PDZ domain-containing protein [Nocardia cerradoensis]
MTEDSRDRRDEPTGSTPQSGGAEPTPPPAASGTPSQEGDAGNASRGWGQPSQWAGPSSQAGGADPGAQSHGSGPAGPSGGPQVPPGEHASGEHRTEQFTSQQGGPDRPGQGYGPGQHPGFAADPAAGHTAPMPPYNPYASGHTSGQGYQQPGSPSSGTPYVAGEHRAGDPYPAGPGADPTGAYAGTPRRRGRAGLLAGAVVLALVAGGIGGAVGTLATRSDDNNAPVNNALNAPAPVDPASASAPPGSVPAVAQKVLPSVVMIRVAGARAEGEGSGVVLSSDGLILTNNHVASGAGPNAKMEVAFQDGTTANASVVGVDPVSDLAVIKAAGKTNLAPIELGTSRNLMVGQPVVAVGSPLGLAGTVTTGIVSALNRPVSTSGEAGSQGTVISAIQTDAAINPGNSGGALVDTNGKLIGINTAIATLGASEMPGSQSGSIGLGFAIPVDQARRVADELTKSGHATYAQIGISVRAQDDVNGARVLDVTPDGPAAKAGIPSGAIVTRVDDQVIDSGNSLIAAVRSHQPGDKVKVTYTDPQGQNPKTVEVTLGAAPAEGGR